MDLHSKYTYKKEYHEYKRRCMSVKETDVSSLSNHAERAKLFSSL